MAGTPLESVPVVTTEAMSEVAVIREQFNASVHEAPNAPDARPGPLTGSMVPLQLPQNGRS